MTIYLLIGLIIIVGIIGIDSDIFFHEINKSVEKVNNNWPHVPEYVVRMTFALVLVIYWIIWPIFLTWIFKEMFDE